MTHRAFALLLAMAAAVAVSTVTPVPAAGQAPAVSRWIPPRLPDGQPDMQGLWVTRQASRAIALRMEEIRRKRSSPAPAVQIRL